MKGKEVITHAVRAEMPDMEQLKENSIRQATKKTDMKRKIWVKRLVPAVACLAVILAAVLAFPHLNSNISSTPETDSKLVSNETNNTPADSAMRGLPVENFSLANIASGGAMVDRRVFMNFDSLFDWSADCFVAVVKVNDTQTTKENQQISGVTILQNIYGDFKTETLQITQNIIENHFCLGTTNLIRQGGVYLLSLTQYDGRWYIMGDLDVLFEVDNTGKVWSHSDFEDFNYYDGTSIESLIAKLENMF